MDAKELQIKNIAAAAHQIHKALEGLPPELWSARLHDEAMTPAETIEHLAACCDMFCVEARGEKKEWGQYSIEDKSPENLFAVWNAEREKAVEALRNSEREDLLHLAAEYIALHDAYHVGQLCTLRIKHQPDWDAYSIYG